jgi:hypothetical protein
MITFMNVTLFCASSDLSRIELPSNWNAARFADKHNN